MNLLITSIGQRGYLVDHFKESAKGEFGIYAADAMKYAPGLQNADKAFVIPLANDPNYFSELLKICQKHDIQAIISINDLELPILARHQKEFQKHDIQVIISQPEVIDCTFDKWQSYEYCRANDIPVPHTYLWSQQSEIMLDLQQGVIEFPILAKPRKGSRSVGIYLIHDEKSLLTDMKQTGLSEISEDEKVIYQEYIDSDQYSIHIFNNEKLEPVSVVTMVNLVKNLGETFHIKTFRDTELTQLGLQIGKKLKHFGPISADVHQRKNGEYVVLEFNPRISGGYSLSHFAGADFPGKIFKLMKGEKIQVKAVDDFEDGVILLKQFSVQKMTEARINDKIKEE